MSKVDLVILGLLIEKPRHGYDILQEIERRDMKHWVGISTPAIYKGLTRLEAKRVLSAHAESGTRHPDRTVYRVTASGKEYFHRLMAEALGDPQHLFLNLMAGVGFAHLEGRQALLTHLESRNRKLEPLLEFLQSHYAKVSHLSSVADDIIQFYIDLIKLEIAWVIRFRKRISGISHWPEGVLKR
jgi:DNA-binding PadR family transcriptional regulator